MVEQRKWSSGAGRLVIDDLQIGTGSGDVLDVPAPSLGSISAVLSISRQVGGDIFIGSGGEQIVLQQVLLAALRADDFVFASLPG